LSLRRGAGSLAEKSVRKPGGNMSLFHKTDPNTGPLAFTGEEAIIAVLFLVVTVDGNIAPEEEDLVIAASNRIKTLRKLGIDGFNDAVQKVRDAIGAKGREEVFAVAVQSLPANLKETVYALTADVVYADGIGKAEENDFLRKVQEALGVSDEVASKVVEVMRLKNRG